MCVCVYVCMYVYMCVFIIKVFKVNIDMCAGRIEFQSL